MVQVNIKPSLQRYYQSEHEHWTVWYIKPIGNACFLICSFTPTARRELTKWSIQCQRYYLATIFSEFNDQTRKVKKKTREKQYHQAFIPFQFRSFVRWNLVLLVSLRYFRFWNQLFCIHSTVHAYVCAKFNIALWCCFRNQIRFQFVVLLNILLLCSVI